MKPLVLFITTLLSLFAEIRIFPIDRAKFVEGARFDFLVEIDETNEINGIDFNTLKVLVNNKEASSFFGKPAKRFHTPKDKTNTQKGVSSYRIDNVSFTSQGSFNVSVEYKGQKKNASYVVLNVATSKIESSDSSPSNVAKSNKAKNVILLIGDGMSLQAIQMARILSKGIVDGKYKGYLEMEDMPHIALITTSGYDSLTTDSANSASAYATGHKSVVNAMGVHADSTSDVMDDPKVENIAEILRRVSKKSIGLVTTSNITDATPAAFITHTRRRDEQNAIALDFLRLKPEVLLGGGLRHFIPKSESLSKRTDDKNLLEMYKNAGYSISFDKNELDKHRQKTKILGLYNIDHLNVYLDREVLKNPSVLGKFNAEPNLMEMTSVALEILSKNEDGFFLMIEGASIDKQLHKMDWQRATYDTIELDKAVKIAKNFARKNKETLVIVVADHAHSASITGTYHENDGKSGREAVRTYQNAVFPTFKDNDNDGFPDDPNPSVTLAVQYANHPDFKAFYQFRTTPSHPTINKQGKHIANPALEGEEYKGNIPYNEDQEVHSADDIILRAFGAGAEEFRGVMDNTEVFFVMLKAMGVRIQ